MKYLALASLCALVAVAAPVAQKREPSVSCGGRSFSGSQVAQAVNNADNNAASSSSYPHTYNDYEGFDFSDYCSSGGFEEFPLTSNGYTGGPPGAYRVIVSKQSGDFCGAVYHAGSGNSFSQCDY
ncbi:unnamed protein product [Parajaminaea phylloscopi]